MMAVTRMDVPVCCVMSAGMSRLCVSCCCYHVALAVPKCHVTPRDVTPRLLCHAAPISPCWAYLICPHLPNLSNVLFWELLVIPLPICLAACHTTSRRAGYVMSHMSRRAGFVRACSVAFLGYLRAFSP